MEPSRQNWKRETAKTAKASRHEQPPATLSAGPLVSLGAARQIEFFIHRLCSLVVGLASIGILISRPQHSKFLAAKAKLRRRRTRWRHDMTILLLCAAECC